MQINSDCSQVLIAALATMQRYGVNDLESAVKLLATYKGQEQHKRASRERKTTPQRSESEIEGQED